MGQKYAAYNNIGEIVALGYDSELSPVPNPLPTNTLGVIEITQEQWAACLTTPGWTVANGELIAPVPPTADVLLLRAQSVQSRILSSACAAQIISGFTSSALGSVNIYASTEVDQRNITQSAQCSKGGLLSCADAAGVWSRQPHTQAQAQQVLEDFVAERDTARLNLAGLEEQIEAATTVEEVQAVVWPTELESTTTTSKSILAATSKLSKKSKS